MKAFSTSLLLILGVQLPAQWNPVNTGLANLEFGSGTHGFTPTHLFARAYNVLYRSADQGDTWTAVTNPIAGNPSEVGYYFNGRYFAGSSSITACIHYTEDEGETWTAATGAPSATSVRGFFEYGGGLYAYTSSAGIYQTVNGNTWVAMNNGLTDLNVIGMASSGPYFVAATVGGGVFRTINAASWAQGTGIAAGDMSGEHVWRMGGSLYYAAQSGAEYVSSDLGATWAPWTQPSFFGLGMVEVKRFGSNLYMETRHLTSGQRDSLYRSTNEGMSWMNITGNLNAADLSGSGLLEHGDNLYLGYGLGSTSEGIYRYSLTTGLADARTREHVPVFPNPVEAMLSVSLPLGASARTWTLQDATGRTVRSGNLVSNTERIDTSDLLPGCYLLCWDDARLAPARVVKQ